MSRLVPPHGGGGLRALQVEGASAAEEHRRAQTLRRLRVTSREKGDLIMLGIGGFTPLEGFMGRADWQGVCDGMRTALARGSARSWLSETMQIFTARS